VSFRWSKAHSDNFGNEMADRLAKEAASNEDIPIVFDRNPKTNIYRELEKKPHWNGKKNWNGAVSLQ